MGTADRGHERGPAACRSARRRPSTTPRSTASSPGFIGSPSMNFVDVTVDGSGDRAGSSGRRLVDPDSRRGCAASPATSPARSSSPASGPEHLEIGEGGAGHAARSGPGPTSSSTSATRSCSTSTPPTRTSSRSSTRSTGSSPGDIVNLMLPLDKLHLFDSETGDGPDRAEHAPGRRLTARATARPRAARPRRTDLRGRSRRARRRLAGPAPRQVPDVPGRHGRARRRHPRATRDIAGHPGAVAIVALDAEDRVPLVRQWRLPADRGPARDPGRRRSTSPPTARPRIRTSPPGASSRRRPGMRAADVAPARRVLLRARASPTS